MTWRMMPLEILTWIILTKPLSRCLFLTDEALSWDHNTSPLLHTNKTSKTSPRVPLSLVDVWTGLCRFFTCLRVCPATPFPVTKPVNLREDSFYLAGWKEIQRRKQHILNPHTHCKHTYESHISFTPIHGREHKPFKYHFSGRPRLCERL